MMTTQAYVCLWFDQTAEEAASFYARTMPGGSLGKVHRAVR